MPGRRRTKVTVGKVGRPHGRTMDEPREGTATNRIVQEVRQNGWDGNITKMANKHGVSSNTVIHAIRKYCPKTWANRF